MHLQVRLAPHHSPPDVDKVLDRVAKAGLNLVAIGGSDLEFGGELALVPEEDQEDQLVEALEGYQTRIVRVADPDSGLKLCMVDNEPGALHRCLKDVATTNLGQGRIIRDILIGVPDADAAAAGQIPVHIYSEQVRTSASVETEQQGPGPKPV
jgi:hypothetical protein